MHSFSFALFNLLGKLGLHSGIAIPLCFQLEKWNLKAKTWHASYLLCYQKVRLKSWQVLKEMLWFCSPGFELCLPRWDWVIRTSDVQKPEFTGLFKILG